MSITITPHRIGRHTDLPAVTTPGDPTDPDAIAEIVRSIAWPIIQRRDIEVLVHRAGHWTIICGLNHGGRGGWEAS